jgi:hypothetical protein
MPKTKTIPPLQANLKVSFAPEASLTQEQLEKLATKVEKLVLKAVKCKKSPMATASQDTGDGFVGKVWQWIHENQKDYNKDAVNWVKGECQYLSSKIEMSDGEKEEKFFEHASEYIVGVQHDNLDCPDMCACAHDLDMIRDGLAEELGVQNY